jgi:hypothetical protein
VCEEDFRLSINFSTFKGGMFDSRCRSEFVPCPPGRTMSATRAAVREKSQSTLMQRI